MGSWRCMVLAVVVGFFFHGLSSAETAPNYSFLRDASTAPSTSYYDYIVVGGGTAGCPLAATLSQHYKVLVLERGGSPYDNPNITNLSAFGASLSDLSHSSPSQRFVSEDGVINARARVLGGGTCLNAGFYTRAGTEYVKAVGWDGRLVNESYEWVEKKVAFRPPMGRWQSAVRDGLVEVGVLPNNGFTFDHINGTKVGGTIFDLKGHRHTAADLLEYAEPKNITVMLYASVHKILFATQGRKRPQAHGVVFRDKSGMGHRAYLRGAGAVGGGSKFGEIIVSSGALGSPQLLMLSGIGPADQLRTHNITVVLDQPYVGQGMSDNPMNSVFIPSPVPIEVSLIQVVGITHFGTYIEAAGGENFVSGANTKDWGMFSPKIGQLSTVPPKERTPEAIAKATEDMNSLADIVFQGGFILEKIMGPLSTGHLTIRNRNPDDNPSVTFNYFKEPEDLERCVRGLEVIEKITDSVAFSKFRYDSMTFQTLLNMTASAPVNLLPKHSNASRSLQEFCKDTVMTIWHYHGGCQAGGRVVDGDYKVVGVDSLRVVDGSTFYFTPGTNPQATVMMLGRYMGVNILRERLAVEEDE